MSWTKSDILALKRSIRRGVKSVIFWDRSVFGKKPGETKLGISQKDLVVGIENDLVQAHQRADDLALRPYVPLAHAMTIGLPGKLIIVQRPALLHVLSTGLPPGHWPSWKRGIWA